MPTAFDPPSNERGVGMLELLVAILILSFGILGIAALLGLMALRMPIGSNRRARMKASKSAPSAPRASARQRLTMLVVPEE